MLVVLQLEDDVIARKGYYNDMKTFSTQEASKEWLYLEFSQLGFIGVCVCVCISLFEIHPSSHFLLMSGSV